MNAAHSLQRPLTVAWISFFPIEWLDGIPDYLHRQPCGHPATWQQSLLAEMERDQRIKLHVVVVRSTFERDDCFERNGVTFHLIKTRPGWRAPSLFWVDTVKIGRVLRESVRPDVVHAWGTEHGAALVALRLRYPHVISIQGLMAWFRTLVPLQRYEKLVAVLERYTLKRARLVSAESVDTSNRVRDAYPQVPVLHIEHPPLHRFFEIQRRPLSGPVNFLTVGKMGNRKGSDLFLHALSRLMEEMDFRCVAVGRPTDTFIESMKGALPGRLWDRVQFKSALSHPDMDREFQNATLMVMPSRADTGPVAVKEAVAAGVPVVASRMGGVPDYVVPGQNGLICEPNNLESLVGQIRAACAHPLFRNGAVNQQTLSEKRAYLHPAVAASQFVEAYFRAWREQASRG
jgi:glycosyltransferase involved in cell wall biosynthesis